jgi:acyl carrier protein
MSETNLRMILQEELNKIVQEELNNIAPEVDLSTVDPAADLREAIDIDSMDFLNLVTALHHRTGIEIPEIDYPSSLPSPAWWPISKPS